MMTKTPYKNIYDVLKFNRFIVLTVVIASGISIITSSLISNKTVKDFMQGNFAIGIDGEVIPLRWHTEQEDLEVEVLDHLLLFHNYFYGIDAINYESNIEKALWLGDSSVDNVYRQKKADGVYNRIVQYSLVQKIISVKSEIDLKAEPYPFRTVTVFEVNRGTTVDTYELTTSGALIHLEKRNFPKNTHGLSITNFFENKLRKIESYESRKE